MPTNQIKSCDKIHSKNFELYSMPTNKINLRDKIITWFVSISSKTYKKYLVLNAYNFLYKDFFKILTGSLIELIPKNNIKGLIVLNSIYIKCW